MRIPGPLTQAQRGAIAVATSLSLIVLVGFLGVVVDLGRIYVAKTELQNAADACALAAAKELDGNAGALTRAENAGITVATRNNVDFQSGAAVVTPSDIQFSANLSGAGGSLANYQSQAAGAPADSKYAMCTLRLPNYAMSLSAIVGMNAQAVASRAVATVAPAQTSCAIPLGVCSKGAAPSYGLTAGVWISGRFDAGGGATGSFNWIDYSPPAGGQSELAALLTGQGVCNTTISQPVGQSGVMGNAAARAWNSRFGLYQGGGGNPQLQTAPPDFSGHAYTALSWPAQANALPNFMGTQRPAHSPYQGNAASGLSISNGYNNTSAANLATYGASRRLATAPIVNCGGWASSQTVPVLSYACILMLHPIGSPGDVVLMEFVGLANDPSSPCSTSGLAGGSFGPLVPVLVQ